MDIDLKFSYLKIILNAIIKKSIMIQLNEITDAPESKLKRIVTKYIICTISSCN